MKIALPLVASNSLSSLQGPRHLQTDLPEGIWTTRGYGYALASFNGTLNLFEETSISCILIDDTFALPDVSFPTEDTAETFGFGLGRYDLDWSEDFQGACANGTTPVVGDDDYESNPLVVFDIVAQTYREHYAYFELRGIDWEGLVEESRGKLTMNATDQELHEVLVSMLTPLKDGHVSLSSSVGSFDAKPQPIYPMLAEEFANQDELDDSDAYFGKELLSIFQNIFGYLDPMFGDPNVILWGRIADHQHVGYMHFLSMAPGADGDEDDDDGVDDDDDGIPIDFDLELDRAFEQLSDTKSLIIDIRLNSGGFDAVSLQILSYLTNMEVLAMRKYPLGVDPSDATEIYLTPNPDASKIYQGKVIVLISESTVSAAEIFTLAALQLPQVTLVGERTNGAFSDVLGRRLPNFWQFGLSNEYYLSPNGTNYEMVGIHPHVPASSGAFDKKERDQGVDSWLELALAEALDGVTTDAPISAPVPPSTDSPVAATTESPVVSETQSPVAPETESPVSSPVDEEPTSEASLLNWISALVCSLLLV